MKNNRTMTKVEAWFLLIAGFIMGTVFTFGMQYWNAPVTKVESIHATAIYESYATQREQGRVKEIIVRNVICNIMNISFRCYAIYDEHRKTVIIKQYITKLRKRQGHSPLS